MQQYCRSAVIILRYYIMLFIINICIKRQRVIFVKFKLAESYQFQSQLASCTAVFGLGIGANLGDKCRGGREKEVQKKANRPSGEQSRTLCVFFELKGDQLLIFPGGTSVIRHATHGVIYASRSSRKRIRPLDTYYALRSSSSSPSSSPSAPSPRSLLISTLSRLSVSISRELSHSSCVEPEKSNEALVGSTNVYRPRDPQRTRYVNLLGGTRIIHGIMFRVVQCALRFFQ